MQLRSAVCIQGFVCLFLPLPLHDKKRRTRLPPAPLPLLLLSSVPFPSSFRTMLLVPGEGEAGHICESQHACELGRAWVCSTLMNGKRKRDLPCHASEHTTFLNLWKKDDWRQGEAQTSFSPFSHLENCRLIRDHCRRGENMRPLSCPLPSRRLRSPLVKHNCPVEYEPSKMSQKAVIQLKLWLLVGRWGAYDSI